MNMNEPKDLHGASMQDPEFRRQFEREWFIEEFLSQIEQGMKSLGMTRSVLAKALNCSQSNVSQLLSGEKNLTVRSMVDLAIAVGLRLRPAFESYDVTPPWQAPSTNAGWECQIIPIASRRSLAFGRWKPVPVTSTELASADPLSA